MHRCKIRRMAPRHVSMMVRLLVLHILLPVCGRETRRLSWTAVAPLQLADRLLLPMLRRGLVLVMMMRGGLVLVMMMR